MPSTISLAQKMKTKLFNAYSGDAGKMLLHTGTIGWILSATAQIFGIANNDKISAEKKKFLIPQEMADAAVNILAFYTVTNGIQNFTKKLASSGKFITPKIAKFCEQYKIALVEDAEGNVPNIGKAILDKVQSFKSTLKIAEEEHISINEQEIKHINEEISKLDKFYDETYSPFESGFKIVGNIAGAVLSSNIITPLLRNPIAAAKQKQALAQEKYEQYENSLNQTITPTIPMQNKLGIDNYRAKTMNSGSMRV